ncbi:MAG: AsmA family protein [Magnetococcales bacterium]|nr:AsmA family protein [Magnetococcales bacterium]
MLGGGEEMNPTLKRGLRVTAGLLGLVVILLVAVPLLIHPNQFRAPIGALVKSATGRTLTIHGEVGLAFFPSLELILRDLSLEGDPAFGTEPMAEARTLVMGVKLLPLLSGRVEMDRAELTGLQLRLSTLEDGRSNWSALLTSTTQGGGPGDTESVVNPAALLNRLLGHSIGGIEIAQATLFWHDRQAGLDLKLEPLAFKTGPIHPGRPVTVAGSCRFLEAGHGANGRLEMKAQLRPLPQERIGIEGLAFQLASGVVNGMIKEVKAGLQAELTLDPRARQAAWSRVELNANLWSDAPWMRELTLGFQGGMEMDLNSGRLAAPQSRLNLLLKANALPPAGVRALLRSDVSADPSRRVLDLDNLEIEGPAGVKVSGEMRAEARPLRLEGSLEARRFDFRALLIALGRTIPAPADGKVCAGAEAEMSFALKDGTWRIPRLELGVDDTHLTGSVEWSVDEARLRFDGRVDSLDLTRFVPLLSGGVKAEGGTEALLPLPARDWRVEGHFQAGRLITPKGELIDLDLVVAARDGVMRADPLNFGLHGGRVRARLELDQRGDEPVVHLKQDAEGVRFGPFLKDWIGWSGIDGKGGWKGRLTTRGRERLAMWRALDGEISLELEEGVVTGMDLVGKVRQAHAQFTRQRAPASGADDTPFNRLTATTRLHEGKARITDLKATGPDLLVTGSGEVDCAKRQVDAALNVDVTTALRSVAIDIERYQGLTQPWTLRGTFDAGKPFEPGTIDFSRVAAPAKE